MIFDSSSSKSASACTTSFVPPPPVVVVVPASSLSLSLSSGRKLFLIAFFFCSIVRLLLIREVGVGFLSLSIFFLDIKKKNISVGFLTSKTTVITTEYSDIDCSDYEELYRSANLFQTWLVGFRDWLVNEGYSHFQMHNLSPFCRLVLKVPFFFSLFFSLVARFKKQKKNSHHIIRCLGY